LDCILRAILVYNGRIPNGSYSDTNPNPKYHLSGTRASPLEIRVLGCSTLSILEFRCVLCLLFPFCGLFPSVLSLFRQVFFLPALGVCSVCNCMGHKKEHKGGKKKRVDKFQFPQLFLLFFCPASSRFVSASRTPVYGENSPSGFPATLWRRAPEEEALEQSRRELPSFLRADPEKVFHFCTYS